MMLRTLLAPNPSPMTLDGTRTFVVGRERIAVIDPGPAVPSHLDAILELLSGRALIGILLTHSHADHAELAEPLAGRTGAPVLAHPDHSHIDTDGGALVPVHTPGHTADHLSFLWESSDEGRVLFVGDAFMGGLDTVMVAPPEGDLADYLDTLRIVEALAPAVLYPAHGPPIRGGAEAARRYRSHRMERIDQVVHALAARGASSPEDLVDAIYGAELHPELRWAAAGSVAAVLHYLVGSGRAQSNGGRTWLVT
jgi:glyoxylase-like metal-dependent hydrolase (beta-lactamase superfamily II)